MQLDLRDDAFRDEGAAWLRTLDTDVIVDLQAVIRISPGYYPTTLVELWRTELSRRGISGILGRANRIKERDPFPVDHPADYEWRFTAESAATLLEQATHGLQAGSCVAYLGTPTTFARGCGGAAPYTHVLLDKNTRTAARPANSKAYCIDLTSQYPPMLYASVAIVDPPWYFDYTNAFLFAANRACRVGAKIMLCQPTYATRPGVIQERAALVNALPSLGMAFHGVKTASIRYHMPHFEARSIKMMSPDLDLPSDWRMGDLLILEKIGDAKARPLDAFISESWSEVAFGPVRIKLRKTIGYDMGSIVPGDMLQTVSRRDPIRTHIGLWTSGNRIYSLTRPNATAMVIGQCHADAMNAQFTLARTSRHARRAGLHLSSGRKLFETLLIEFQEHSQLGLNCTSK